MSSSIFHFFKNLVENKEELKSITKLDEFPFDENLLSCKRVGQFPDLAIRICKDNELFTGGELIELKDTKNTKGLSYSISSFNSTVPTGKKPINKVIKGENSVVLAQMTQSGDDVFSLEERDVFYLVRGRNKIGNSKIVLIHGSFFETVKASDLIMKAFNQVLNERFSQSNTVFDKKTLETLEKVFSEQESFSKVRHVENASVSLRFRIMTEAKAEGNILNSKKYPEISENTLNFILPSHGDDEDRLNFDKMNVVFDDLNSFEIFHIKHHFNGNFLVFQTGI